MPEVVRLAGPSPTLCLLLKLLGFGTAVLAKCSARSLTSAPGRAGGARWEGGWAAMRSRLDLLTCSSARGVNGA